MISGGQDSRRVTYNKQYFCNDPRSSDNRKEIRECGKDYDAFFAGIENVTNKQALGMAVSHACFMDVTDQLIDDPRDCARSYFIQPENLKRGKAVSGPEGVTPRMPRLLTHPDLLAMQNAFANVEFSGGRANTGNDRTRGNDNNDNDSDASGSTVKDKGKYHLVDGNRISSPFAPDVENKSRTGWSGSLKTVLEPIPSGDTFGLTAAGELSYGIAATPDYSVSANFAASILSWPNLAPSYTGTSALQKGWLPKGDKNSQWTDMGAYLSWQIPIDGGHLEVAVPKINLLSVNDKSIEVVSKIQARLGDGAGEIFLNSVLAPHFANVSNYENFKKVWSKVIGEYYPAFEGWMASSEVPSQDKASLFAEMFDNDPFAIVAALALWSGKTHQETVEALKKEEPSLFQDNQGGVSDEKWAKNFLRAAGKLQWSKAYELSDGYENRRLPKADKFPSNLLLRAGYGSELRAKERVFAKALFNANSPKELSEAIAQLKKDSEDARIPYPFDISGKNNPGNPWAVQKRLNDFVTEIVVKKYQKPAKWLFNLDSGMVDRTHSYPGLGFKPAVIWRPLAGDDYQSVEASVWGFVGAARSLPIDPAGPSIAADGVTGALGTTVKYEVKISEKSMPRKAAVEGGLSYTGAGTGAAEGTPQFINANLGVNATAALTSDFLVTPGLKWQWRHNAVNGADRNFIIPSLNMMLGGHIFLRNELKFFIGTQGGGDHVDVSLRPGTPGEIIDTDTPISDVNATVGQDGRIYTGLLGYEWSPGNSVGVGFSWLHFSDYLQINDGDNVGDGSVSRKTVLLAVETAF